MGEHGKCGRKPRKSFVFYIKYIILKIIYFTNVFQHIVKYLNEEK